MCYGAQFPRPANARRQNAPHPRTAGACQRTILTPQLLEGVSKMLLVEGSAPGSGSAWSSFTASQRLLLNVPEQTHKFVLTCNLTPARRIYGREGAIPPHVLYRLVPTRVTLAVPDIRDGRQREGVWADNCELDLWCAQQAHTWSCRRFPPVGPSTVRLVKSSTSVGRVCRSANRNVPIAVPSFFRKHRIPPIEMNSVSLPCLLGGR